MGKCHLGFSNCSHVTFFSISSTLQLNCSWSAEVLYSMECTLEARTPAELRPLCLPLSLLAFATLLMRLLRLNFFFPSPKQMYFSWLTLVWNFFFYFGIFIMAWGWGKYAKLILTPYWVFLPKECWYCTVGKHNEKWHEQSETIVRFYLLRNNFKSWFTLLY